MRPAEINKHNNIRRVKRTILVAYKLQLQYHTVRTELKGNDMYGLTHRSVRTKLAVIQPPAEANIGPVAWVNNHVVIAPVTLENEMKGEYEHTRLQM